MSKGLEALLEAKRVAHISITTATWDYVIEPNFDIAEKELKEYQEIKDIAEHYNWDDITSEIFNVKTDKKYRDLFNGAIVNIQEDYRKARALEIIKRISHYDIPFLDYVLDNGNITKEEYNLLKEVLNVA